MGQWDSVQHGCRLSAVGLPLTAYYSYFPPPTSHPERSEGSRYKTLVSLLVINTGRREDGKTVRRQMADGKRVQGRVGTAPLESSGSAHKVGVFKGEL